MKTNILITVLCAVSVMLGWLLGQANEKKAGRLYENNLLQVKCLSFLQTQEAIARDLGEKRKQSGTFAEALEFQKEREKRLTETDGAWKLCLYLFDLEYPGR